MAKKVIILGAGVSGLAAAWRLSQNGIETHIIETSQDIGGLAGTLHENDCSLDFGPHSFFSEDKQILNAVLDLFDNKLKPRERTVKFYYRGKYINYPLTPQSVLFQMGLLFGIKASLSFLKGKILTRKKILDKEQEEKTVEEWAIANFGEHIYRVFFKPYTEQFWKIPCSELSARTIPSHTKTSFANTLRLFLHQKVSKTGDSLIEREMLPTYYPDTGFSEIAERIAKVVIKNKGQINVGCEAIGINEIPGGGAKVLYKQDGRTMEIEGDFVISTIPLPSFVKMLNPQAPETIMASADKLDYRSLVVLGMLTSKRNVLKCSYMYLLDRPFNRIFEMNTFSAHTSPAYKNIIAVEIPCLRDSIPWRANKEELLNMCISTLEKDGFLNAGDVENLFLIKRPYAYPIYRKNYAIHLSRLMDYINKHKLVATLGRCGEFMYMDIDKCIKRAFDFVDNYISAKGK